MSQVQACQVAIAAANPHEAEVLANLLEHYAHELSGTFGLKVGADGRFGYKDLPLYWTEPDRRFPFLIRVGTHLAGFTLATRGAPVTSDPEVFDVAEFFILRAHRRSNVGRRAAELLWTRFPGRWIVRVSEGNADGYRFWLSVIATHTRGDFIETTRPGRTHPWRVFAFWGGERGATR